MASLAVVAVIASFVVDVNHAHSCGPCGKKQQRKGAHCLCLPPIPPPPPPPAQSRISLHFPVTPKNTAILPQDRRPTRAHASNWVGKHLVKHFPGTTKGATRPFPGIVSELHIPSPPTPPPGAPAPPHPPRNELLPEKALFHVLYPTDPEDPCEDLYWYELEPLLVPTPPSTPPAPPPTTCAEFWAWRNRYVNQNWQDL
jgi:hypothetical protein